MVFFGMDIMLILLFMLDEVIIVGIVFELRSLWLFEFCFV